MLNCKVHFIKLFLYLMLYILDQNSNLVAGFLQLEAGSAAAVTPPPPLRPALATRGRQRPSYYLTDQGSCYCEESTLEDLSESLFLESGSTD